MILKYPLVQEIFNKNIMSKQSRNNKILLFFGLIMFSLVLLILINSYFGWYGYERWKFRKGTYGDKKESIERGVFIKDLNYISNLDLKYFKVYFERGFKCGKHSLYETNINFKTNYPYQISMNTTDTINNVYFEIVNYYNFDSINNEMLDICLFTEAPVLKDTIYLKAIRFDKKRDSIGYIKIWDKNMTK